MSEIRMYEELGANGHTALNVMQYDGWLLRFSEGYTGRANSVSVLYPSTIDPETKIDHCEACYRARNLPCMFKLTDGDDELNALLERRGYRTVTPTWVMAAELRDGAWPEGDAEIFDRPTEEWIRCHSDFVVMNNPAFNDVFRRMLDKVLVRTRYASVRADGRMIACAATAAERGYALLQYVAVDPEYRGRGYGRRICGAMLADARKNGAQRAYLQVVESNKIAVSLYESMGFEKKYSYWYMKKD